METKNQILFENDVRVLEKRIGRKLNEEEFKQLRATYDNPIFTSVSLRKGEGDIRKLKVGDYHQLQNRNERDNLAYLKYINGQMSDIYILLCVIAKKLGVDDPLAEASNFAIDINNKINENK